MSAGARNIGRQSASRSIGTRSSAGPGSASVAASASSTSPSSSTSRAATPNACASATQSGVSPRSTSLRRPPQNMSCCWRTMPRHAVVEHHELDRQPLVRGGGELLHVEQQRALAGDAHDGGVRAGDLGADRGRQAEAHRAEPAGGDPAARAVEAQPVGRPHLVLADVGGHDRVALDGVERVERGLGGVPRRRVVAPAVDPLPPGVEPRRVALVGGRDRRPARARAQPTIGTCAATFLSISDGSTSMCTTLARGANSSRSPVTRSSKRAPTATIRSASSIAQLAAGCRACRASRSTAGRSPGRRRAPSASS